MERRIAVLAVCVLLGAAISVLVAWGCAAWSTPGPGGVWLPGAQPGRARLFADAQGFFTPGTGPQPEGIGVGFGVEWTELSKPALAGSWVSAGRFVHVLAGWPAPAFEGATELPGQPLAWSGPPMLPGSPGSAPTVILAPRGKTSSAPIRVYAGIARPGSAGPTTSFGKPVDRILPLRPVWSGLVIDVVFYTAIMCLLLPGPFALRRLGRALRRRCMACGYPRGTSAVCTECGRPVPASGGLALMHDAFGAAVATAAQRRVWTCIMLVLLALVPGAIINVAVAWGCATASGTQPAGSAISRAEPDTAWWWMHAPPGVSETGPLSASCARLGPGKSWTSMWQSPGTYAVRIRAGWPMPAMERDWWEAEISAQTNVVYLALPARSYTLWRAALPAPGMLSGASDLVVPVRPVFPGFLINSLLYALPFVLIRWGAVALRSRFSKARSPAAADIIL